jgi:hypothetical protein
MAWLGNYSNTFEVSLILIYKSLLNFIKGNQVGNQVGNYVRSQGGLKTLSEMDLLWNEEDSKGVCVIINTTN